MSDTFSEHKDELESILQEVEAKMGLSAKVPATFVPFGCATALLSTFYVIT